MIFGLGATALVFHTLSNSASRLLLVGLFLIPAYNYAQQQSPPSHANTHNTAIPSIHKCVTHQSAGTSLSLKDSDLHPEQPIIGEKADFQGFSRELIQLRWRANDPIDLYVIRPHGVEKPHPVLYLYSYPSETNRFLDNQYCERVTKGGFAAIGFVSALTGQRYHDRPMRDWFVSEMQESLTNSVHDVQMILNYLSGRNDFDLTEVGMFGQGSGGTIAILAATVDPRIHALDLLDPWGDWPDWLAKSTLVPEEERPMYLKPKNLASLAPLDPVRWLPELKNRTIRVQFVADDPVTPLDATERIAAALPPSAQIVRYEGTRELYQATSGGRLFDWIKHQLKSPTTALAENGNDKGTVREGLRPEH
jgi:hypothetical protein